MNKFDSATSILWWGYKTAQYKKHNMVKTTSSSGGKCIEFIDFISMITKIQKQMQKKDFELCLSFLPKCREPNINIFYEYPTASAWKILIDYISQYAKPRGWIR